MWIRVSMKFIPPPPELIQYRSETVIYLGLWFSVWGHVITDNIRRIWFLKNTAFRHEFKNCPLVYIPFEGQPLEQQKNFRRLLEILKVDVDELQPITQPTRFENIILPDESIFYVNGRRNFTDEYRETIDRIRSFALRNKTPTMLKKIYYFYGRNQFGEDRLAKYLQSKGFAAVLPERLTVDEQLNLLINAEVFASTVGSCSHNSLFLRDGIETIFIPRAANYIPFQPILDQVHPINANYVDSSLSVFNINHDLFCFIISRQLKQFFGDRFEGYQEDDFKIFLQYVAYSMKIGRKVNSKQVKGYGVIYEDFLAQLGRRKDLLNAYGIVIK